MKMDNGLYSELDYKVEVTYDDVEMRGYDRVIIQDEEEVFEEVEEEKVNSLFG